MSFQNLLSCFFVLKPNQNVVQNWEQFGCNLRIWVENHWNEILPKMRYRTGSSFDLVPWNMGWESLKLNLKPNQKHFFNRKWQLGHRSVSLTQDWSPLFLPCSLFASKVKKVGNFFFEKLKTVYKIQLRKRSLILFSARYVFDLSS